MADSKEAQFQQDIITAMVAQGWLTGPASGYDRRTALYTEDFLGYFKDAWPERWDKFAKANPNKPDDVLVQKLVREMNGRITHDRDEVGGWTHFRIHLPVAGSVPTP